jgi:hypothetical protein
MRGLHRYPVAVLSYRVLCNLPRTRHDLYLAILSLSGKLLGSGRIRIADIKGIRCGDFGAQISGHGIS